MPKPTKFDLMRQNRELRELRIADAEFRADVQSTIAADLATLRDTAQLIAEPAVPTMEIDGVLYREEPEVSICEDCAFQHLAGCEAVHETAVSVFGAYCGPRGVIYIRAE